MSGHSKWKKIKRQKGAADLKKGNLFTKLGQAITLAVREGGGSDPNMNFMLRMAIEKAKEVNMPKSTMDRAVDKGLGKSDNGPVEDISYDLTGKGGVAVIVDCLTDNKNRTVNEIRQIISDYDLDVTSGSLKWQFEEKGMIVVQALEVMEVIVRGKKEIQYKQLDKKGMILDLMELDGVEDIFEEEAVKEEMGIDISTSIIKLVLSKHTFKKVYDAIRERKIKIISAEMIKRSTNYVDITKKMKSRFATMREALFENLDVVSVWTNIR